jgi:hypothetical protein
MGEADQLRAHGFELAVEGVDPGHIGASVSDQALKYNKTAI